LTAAVPVFVRWISAGSLVVLVSTALVACASSGGGELAGVDAPPQLALVRSFEGTGRDLVLIDANGTNPTPLVGDALEGDGPRPSLFTRPSWSPDGQLIAFDGGAKQEATGAAEVLKAINQRDIYTVRTDGTDLVRLTEDQASFLPVWSPDGESIVFARSFGEPPPLGPQGSNIWVMEADGSNPRPLTPEQEGTFQEPHSISPEGEKVAFTANYGRAGVIFSVSLDGGSPALLTEGAWDPAYSPDGEAVAFITARDKHGKYCFGDPSELPQGSCSFAGELYVMNIAGGEDERLTETGSLHEERPDWSSDGERIVYQQLSEVGLGAVFMVNADGSCPTPITPEVEADTYFYAPAWRPGSSPGPIQC
jgi:Tol biopolymer transport system component